MAGLIASLLAIAASNEGRPVIRETRGIAVVTLRPSLLGWAGSSYPRQAALSATAFTAARPVVVS